MIVYYTYEWNPFEGKENFKPYSCEKREVNKNAPIEQIRQIIVNHWFETFKRKEIELGEKHHEQFFVFDEEGELIDNFAISLEIKYNIGEG